MWACTPPEGAHDQFEAAALAPSYLGPLYGRWFNRLNLVSTADVRAVDVNISAGLLIFPEGEDRLKREENLSSSTRFSFPGPNVNFAVSAGLAFFP